MANNQIFKEVWLELIIAKKLKKICLSIVKIWNFQM